MKILFISLSLLTSLSALAQKTPLVVQCEMSLPYRVVGREVTVTNSTVRDSYKILSPSGTRENPGIIRKSSQQVLNLAAVVDYTALGAKSQLRATCVEKLKDHQLSTTDVFSGEMFYMYLDDYLYKVDSKTPFLKEMITVNTSELPEEIWPANQLNFEIEKLCHKATQNTNFTTCEVQPHVE